jgi:hypothetical protein
MTKAMSRPQQLKFVGKVTNMGKEKMIVYIPKEFHKDIEHLRGKHVKITVDEIL